MDWWHQNGDYVDDTEKKDYENDEKHDKSICLQDRVPDPISKLDSSVFTWTVAIIHVWRRDDENDADENDGDDENADDSMRDADNNHHNHHIFSTHCIQDPLTDTSHSRCLFEHRNAYHIYIPGFQDPARSSPLLTHLARYSAEVPNSASASTWLQPPQITHRTLKPCHYGQGQGNLTLTNHFDNILHPPATNFNRTPSYHTRLIKMEST